MDIKNLYLDFEKNRERLIKYGLSNIKRNYKDFLPNYDKDCHDILDYFTSRLFSEGLANIYYVSNTSLKDGYLDISIRPKLENRPISSEFPKGLSIVLRGHLSGRINKVLIIDRIIEVSDSEQRNFEVEVNARPFYSEENVYRINRENVLFDDYFILELPEISMETKANLESWNNYLEWKEQIVKNKLIGLRYIKIDIVDGHYLIYVAVENTEEYKKVRKVLRKNELMLFPLEYSIDKWDFKLNEKKRIDSFGIGDFVRDKILDFEEIETEIELNFQDSKIFKDIPWEEFTLVKIYFRLTDEQEEELEEIIGEQISSNNEAINEKNEKAVTMDIELLKNQFIDNILERYPGEGFLSFSAVGEMTLIRRQRSALNELKMQSGYAPFLSSWLFDIKEANTSREEFQINDDEWLMDNINEDQKRAVKKMMNAPDIFLVQGPPGTGKTTVIAESIYQLTKQGKKILLSSQANLAVDNALERLENVPEIRAIRLGRNKKISEDGKRFAENNVLKNFYNSISRKIHEEHLNMWDDLDKKFRYAKKVVEELQFLDSDITRLEYDINKKQEEIESTYKEYKNQENITEKLVDKNLKIENTKINLNKAKIFFLEEKDSTFVIIKPILDLIWNEIIGPINSLKSCYIDLNKYWFDKDDPLLTEADKTKFVKQIMKDWNKVEVNLDKMRNDLYALKKGSISGNSKINFEMIKLEEKSIELLEKMKTDSSKVYEWQQVCNEIEKLKQQNKQGVDKIHYHYIFNGLSGNKSFYDEFKSYNNTETINCLVSVIEKLESVSRKIEVGKKKIATAIEHLNNQLDITKIDKSLLKKAKAIYLQSKAELEELNSYYNDKLGLVNKKKVEISSKLDTCVDNSMGIGELIITCQNKLEYLDTRLQNEAITRNTFEDTIRRFTDKLSDKDVIENDKEYFLDTYIDSCNVIGITCTENKRTLEDKNHTWFDVAIIDEVSKATPPELLLSMIRAKKTILVGDHRQLPPLFKEKENTYEEIINDIEESDEYDDETLLTKENFEKFKDMVTASLFKDFFEEADDSIKETLFTQYRMHPDIMNVINNFYEYRLNCGIKEPEKTRNHGFTIKSPDNLEFITPNKHALWIDTSRAPNGEIFYEVQKGTSKTNPLEAMLMIEMLRKINKNCLQQGYNTHNRKQVGVITFYGKQIGEIRRRLRKEKFEALKIDVNTVDKFQGKEKAIILVSLVRNKNIKYKSKNSFVASFQRINVAFSRAQELLIIFGAKDMFYDYPVELPNMNSLGFRTRKVYTDIIDFLNRKACFWESSRVIAKEKYNQLIGG